jgi:hypothetical protein
MQMEQDRSRKGCQQIVKTTFLAMNQLVQVFLYFLHYLNQVLSIQKITRRISIKVKLFKKKIKIIITKIFKKIHL